MINSDSPTTIKCRFLSVLMVALISLVVVQNYRVGPGDDLMSSVGIKWSNIWDVMIHPLLITASLFLGTLVVFKDTYTWSELKEVMAEEIPDLIFFRNYVVAPLSEELIFRGVIFSLLSPIDNSIVIVLISALLFSLSHSHHYFLQKLEGSEPMSLMSGIFQMSYTFVFGCYTGAFFSRTQSIFTTVTLHIFCNFCGFPDFDTLFSNKTYKISTLAGLGFWIISSILYFNS